MTRPRQQALLAKNVGHIRVGLYAHRDYLAVSGPIRTIDDLQGHALVSFDRGAAILRADHEELAWLPDAALRTDNQLAQRTGFGVGMVQDPTALRDPSRKPALRETFVAYLSAWIVMHEDLRRTRRMRIAFDALDEGISAHVRSGETGSSFQRR